MTKTNYLSQEKVLTLANTVYSVDSQAVFGTLLPDLSHNSPDFHESFFLLLINLKVIHCRLLAHKHQLEFR